MGILDSLKFAKVDAPKKTAGVDKRIVVRRKMLENIERQIDLVDAEIEKKPVNVAEGKRKPTYRYGLTKGTYYYHIHYGNIPVLVAGNNAVEGGSSLESLKKVMQQLSTAVADGELDQELMEASEKSPVAKAHAQRAADGLPPVKRGGRRKAS